MNTHISFITLVASLFILSTLPAQAADTDRVIAQAAEDFRDYKIDKACSALQPLADQKAAKELIAMIGCARLTGLSSAIAAQMLSPQAPIGDKAPALVDLQALAAVTSAEVGTKIDGVAPRKEGAVTILAERHESRTYHYDGHEKCQNPLGDLQDPQNCEWIPPYSKTVQGIAQKVRIDDRNAFIKEHSDIKRLRYWPALLLLPALGWLMIKMMFTDMARAENYARNLPDVFERFNEFPRRER